MALTALPGPAWVTAWRETTPSPSCALLFPAAAAGSRLHLVRRFGSLPRRLPCTVLPRSLPFPAAPSPSVSQSTSVVGAVSPSVSPGLTWLRLGTCHSTSDVGAVSPPVSPGLTWLRLGSACSGRAGPRGPLRSPGAPSGAPQYRLRAHLGRAARAGPPWPLPSPHLPPLPWRRAVGFLLPLLARVGRSNTGPGFAPPGPFPWPPRVPTSRAFSRAGLNPRPRVAPPPGSTPFSGVSLLLGLHCYCIGFPPVRPPAAMRLTAHRFCGPGAGPWLDRAWVILLDCLLLPCARPRAAAVLAPAPGLPSAWRLAVAVCCCHLDPSVVHPARACHVLSPGTPSWPDRARCSRPLVAAACLSWSPRRPWSPPAGRWL